jgi:ribosomal protein L13E
MSPDSIRAAGASDQVARDLGINAATASALQGFAAAQLDAEEVPEPGMALMFATPGGMMVVMRRRNTGKKARLDSTKD